MNDILVLDILLNNAEVGSLSLLPGERMIFAFDERYIEDADRPVLSLSYYDRLQQLLTDAKPTQLKAPTFFSNLLPEGPLREYLAMKGGVKYTRDFALLSLLGEDLPGAVIIRPRDENNFNKIPATDIEVESIPDDVLRFSLAGVQLKFSALMKSQGGLTIPAHGVGGDWIVKLPSARFDQVAENEFMMMSLASEVGIDVPEIKLVELNQIQGLPEMQDAIRGKALAIKRFDRVSNSGTRIHIEDFAQVFGVYPERKYERVSYNNIAKMLAESVGQESVLEYVRRLVFSLLIGNADMHLKNFSLIYPDAKNPQLSPAYDLLSTLIYIPDPKMALSIKGEKKMENYNLGLIRKLVRDAEVSEVAVEKIAAEVVERTVETWKARHKDFRLKPEFKNKIEAHLLKTAGQFN